MQLDTDPEPAAGGQRAADAAARQAQSRRALERYRRRMRPWRLAYAAAVLALIVGVGVVVKIAYAHGEISHARLRTAAVPAPSVALGTPSADLQTAWRSSDRAAIGTPYWGGTVVTYSRHAVSGRDARTGAVTWSYTRSDRTVCTAAQLGGVTIAVFGLAGNCDELTAVDSETGARRWTRTLDKDGHPIDGRPSFAVGQYTFLVAAPQVIYAISPDGTASAGNGGLDRWVFAEQGCTINGAVLGSQGALISQTCVHPNCGSRQFCGPGPQLLLRDPTAGDDSNDTKNPDKIIWNLLGSALRPVSADGVLSAMQPDGRTLTLLGRDKGATVGSVSLGRSVPGGALALGAAAGGPPTAVPVARGELLHLGGATYSLAENATSIGWTAGGNAPTLTATDGSAAPDAAHSVLLAPTSTGLAQLDVTTGAVQHDYRLPEPASSSARVYPLGTGFLIAGTGTVVYR